MAGTGEGVSLNFEDRDGGPDRERELRTRATETLAHLLADPPGLILTPSCTSALELAAIAAGISAGDEVVVPAFTHPSTANAFLLRGATIRVGDVDPDTLNLDPAALDHQIGPATRAIVPMHYAGVAADMDRLERIAGTVGAVVIEDAAHGMFASLHGTPLGRIGDLGCISFHRTKNISTISGGALVVNRPHLMDRAEVAAHKGTNVKEFERGVARRYEWAGPGIDGLMGSAALAMLIDQLDRADGIQRRRHRVWDRYRSELEPWSGNIGVRLPVVPEGRGHPAHLFHLVMPTTEDRDRLVEHCAQSGVQTARHYVPLDASRFGREVLAAEDRCPIAGDLAERLLRLPLHHGLDDVEVDRVVAAVASFVA